MCWFGRRRRSRSLLLKRECSPVRGRPLLRVLIEFDRWVHPRIDLLPYDRRSRRGTRVEEMDAGARRNMVPNGGERPSKHLFEAVKLLRMAQPENVGIGDCDVDLDGCFLDDSLGLAWGDARAE